MILDVNSEQNLPKELESEVPARFQDCDPFGHLNNARYMDYFINAREDQLIQFYGINIYEHADQSKANWVIAKTQIAYLRPVLVMEKVRIRTRIIHYTDNAIVVEGLMLDHEGHRLKCLSWVEFAYVSLTTGRPIKHTPDYMDLFRQVLFSDSYSPDGFNQRVDVVRAEVKGKA
jgi:acyl-CoA thioester hydrolase